MEERSFILGKDHDCTAFSNITCMRITSLLQHLTPGKKYDEVDVEKVNEVIQANGYIICVGEFEGNEDPEDLIAMATLIVIEKLTGKYGELNDVVVAPDYRGKGYGIIVVTLALKEAKRLGLKGVKLTSRPDRIAANELYQKLGFKKKETNVYHYEIS